MISAHREAKLQARRDLHDALHDVAYVYPSGSRRFKVCRVRAHTEWGALGDVKGTSFVFAERLDTTKSQMIFLVEEHMPERGDTIAITPTEVWRVEAVDPVYNITQAAKVARVGEKEAATFLPATSFGAYTALRGLLPICEGLIE